MPNMTEKQSSQITKSEKVALFGMGAAALYQNQKLASLVNKLQTTQELEGAKQLEESRRIASAVQHGNLLQEQSLEAQREAFDLQKSQEQERLLENGTKELAFQLKKHIDMAEKVKDEVARMFILRAMAQLVNGYDLSTKNLSDTREKEYLSDNLERLEKHRADTERQIADGNFAELREVVEAEKAMLSSHGSIAKSMQRLEEIEGDVEKLEAEVASMNSMSKELFQNRYGEVTSKRRSPIILWASLALLIISLFLFGTIDTSSEEITDKQVLVSLLFLGSGVSLAISLLLRVFDAITLKKRRDLGTAKRERKASLEKKLEQLALEREQLEAGIKEQRKIIEFQKSKFATFFSLHPDAGSIDLVVD